MCVSLRPKKAIEAASSRSSKAGKRHIDSEFFASGVSPSRASNAGKRHSDSEFCLVRPGEREIWWLGPS